MSTRSSHRLTARPAPNRCMHASATLAGKVADRRQLVAIVEIAQVRQVHHLRDHAAPDDADSQSRCHTFSPALKALVDRLAIPAVPRVTPNPPPPARRSAASGRAGSAPGAPECRPGAGSSTRAPVIAQRGDDQQRRDRVDRRRDAELDLRVDVDRQRHLRRR